MWYTHTHNRFTALLEYVRDHPGEQSRYQRGKTRKVKTNLDLLEQEMVSGNGICWAICKSAPRPRQPRQHPTTQFFTGWMPFLPPNQQRQSTEWSHKVSCRCLLDLSAAFDTIDHDILISRLLSWFNCCGSFLSWFESYLASRSFRVKCHNYLSSLYSSSAVFFRAVLLVLCFSSCTPLPSALSSLPFLWTTTFMQMTLNSSPFIHLTLTKTLLTFKMLYSRSLLGWLPIFKLSTPPRQNSCS